MKIDDELIDKLSNLAKLEFKGKEREQIKSDLERMLQFVEILKEVNTDDVEPLVYMTEEYNITREDEVHQTLSQKDALANAPSSDSDYFKVPKVIQKK